MFERIIVGVDGHGGGEDAIALARKFLAPGGEFTLAHVLAHDGHGCSGASAAYEASGWQRAAALLEKVRADAGVDAHLRWCVSPSVGSGRHERSGREIGVGYDGSPDSKHAVEFARRLAARWWCCLVRRIRSRAPSRWPAVANPRWR